MKILTFLFGNAFSQSKKDRIAPEKYGWQLEYDDDPNCFYIKGGYILYESTRGEYVFDRRHKNGPGVIARLNGPLLDEDFQYMDAHIEAMDKIANRNKK